MEGHRHGNGSQPNQKRFIVMVSRFSPRSVPTVISGNDKVVCLMLPQCVDALGEVLKREGERIAALFGLSFRGVSFDTLEMQITDRGGVRHLFSVTPLSCISWSGLERLQKSVVSGSGMPDLWFPEMDNLKGTLATHNPERYGRLRHAEKHYRACGKKMDAWRKWLDSKGIPLMPSEGFVPPVSESEMELKHREIFG